MKNASLGDRIKALRGQESRPIFAGRFGISVDTISRYENGQTFPGTDFVQKLCNHYNISADWLIYGDDRKLQNQAPESPSPATTQQEPKSNKVHDSSKLNAEKALDLSLAAFEALWDEYRREKEARRGWLQVEVIKRFPEFVEWLEQRPVPLSPAQIAALKKDDQLLHRALPSDLLKD